MKIKNPKIVFCTQKSNPSECLVYNSMDRVSKTFKDDVTIRVFENNKESLAKRYNQAIKESYNDGTDCLILLHDDVMLDDDPISILESSFDNFDLVGVAGASKVEIKKPALWHLMGGGWTGGSIHGAVRHIINRDGMMCKELTYFGPTPHRVVMIDGVFMALNRNIIEKMTFDEKCPSNFHFYDLNFSLDCHQHGFKVGVENIRITHASHGLSEVTEDWKKGQDYFLEKYDN